MKALSRRRALLACLGILGAARGAGAAMERPHAARPIRKLSDRFPNILLRTQDDRPVRFYDDLVKDRVVTVNLMYTACEGICPGTTANLVKVHKHLGDRVGRDILMLSISIDRRDTPETLKRYAQRFGNKAGWLYLAGDYDEVTALRRALGMYELDPVADANKSSHSGIVTFGNDRTDRWAALPAEMDSEDLARTILRVTRDRVA